MKKFTIYLFAIAVAFSFASCNKSVKSRLPGTWSVTAQSITSTVTIAGSPTTTTNNGSGGTYTFNSDGTGTDNNNGGAPTSFKWAATDNSITFTDADGSYTVTVSTNEKKKERWTIDYSETTTDPNFGQVTIKVSGTMDLSKQ